MTQSDRYASTISGASSLLPETCLVLTEIAQGTPIDSLRERIIAENWFGKRSERSREKLWQNIHNRYLSEREESFIRLLARTISSSLPEGVKNLILLYEFAQSDRLVHDLTAKCLYGLYRQGRSFVAKEDVYRWLDEVKATHPELDEWSTQTRKRVAQHYLKIASDAGLLEGAKRKTFHRVHVPLPAFLWVLYRLKEPQLPTRAVIQAESFRIFFLDRKDVERLLHEADSEGFVRFRSAGDIVDLTYQFESLAEVMDGFTPQVQ